MRVRTREAAPAPVTPHTSRPDMAESGTDAGSTVLRLVYYTTDLTGEIGVLNSYGIGIGSDAQNDLSANYLLCGHLKPT